jgi:hypothetical protein
MCWVGRAPKKLTYSGFYHSVAHAKRAVLSAPIELTTNARKAFGAAVQIVRALASHEGATTSPPTQWQGACQGDEQFLPGTGVLNCVAFDTASQRCYDQLYLYGPPAKGAKANRRWEAIGAIAPPTCS